MSKAYSLDLRERVVGFVDAGQSWHAAAAHFGVSVSIVVKLVNPIRATGRLEPKRLDGRRHAKLDRIVGSSWRGSRRWTTSPCGSWRPTLLPPL